MPARFTGRPREALPVTDSVHSPSPDPTAAGRPPADSPPDLYQPDREAMPLPALRALVDSWPQLQELRQAAKSNATSCHNRRRHAAS